MIFSWFLPSFLPPVLPSVPFLSFCGYRPPSFLPLPTLFGFPLPPFTNVHSAFASSSFALLCISAAFPWAEEWGGRKRREEYCCVLSNFVVAWDRSILSRLARVVATEDFPFAGTALLLTFITSRRFCSHWHQPAVLSCFHTSLLSPSHMISNKIACRISPLQVNHFMDRRHQVKLVNDLRY